MARVIWAPQAYADLEAIGDFIAREAPGYAQMTSVEQLQLFPLSGRVVPEIGIEAIREIIFRGYRVMHIVSDEKEDQEVQILTIVHSSTPFGKADV